jgi:hypothetical protein
MPTAKSAKPAMAKARRRFSFFDAASSVFAASRLGNGADARSLAEGSMSRMIFPARVTMSSHPDALFA